MRRIILAIAALIILAATPMSYAAGLGLSAKVGTLGAGGDLTLGLNDYFSIRGQINGMTYEYNRAFDEVSVDADIQLLTYGAMLDMHIFGGGFRISAGALKNDNKITLVADPTEPLEIDGVEYNINSFSGGITFDEVSPYIGIGYGSAAGSDGRWHFSCDFGVLYQGEPKITATAVATDSATQSTLDSVVESKRKEIEEDIRNVRWYPVISLGVSFRF